MNASASILAGVMGRNESHLDLPAFGVCFPKAVIVPNGNGDYTVKPGRPQIWQYDDECGLPEAARILGLSQRRVNEMCASGVFVEGQDWRQPGGERGKIFIKRAAVLARSGRQAEELMPLKPLKRKET